MITFEIKLSVNQIACLKSIRELNDRRADHVFDGLPNWISGTRMLLAERLIEWVPDPKGKEVRNDADMTESVRKTWRITEKGRLTLRLFELDVADAARSIGEKVEQFTTAKKGSRTIEKR